MLRNRQLLAKLKQPLPIVALAIAKSWLKKKSAFEPIITLPTRKKLQNIEKRSLEGFKIGIDVGGKSGKDYNYQNLHQIIEGVLEDWKGVEFDGKQIKLKKDEPK